MKPLMKWHKQGAYTPFSTFVDDCPQWLFKVFITLLLFEDNVLNKLTIR